MANEVAKKEEPKALIKKEKTIAGMLSSPDSSWAKELAKMMPNEQEVARFMSVALAQLADPKVGPKLAKCTVPSFYNSIMKAARQKILPDGVNANLIPYDNICTLQPTYKGLCDMAIREKIAIKFASDIVRKNDIFEWSNGELQEHTITSWDEDERGPVVGVWVRAYLPDADGSFNPALHADERMSTKEIEHVRSKSQNPNGVWDEWFDEMAKKSCVKRIFKKMRNTPALAEAIADDNKEYVLDNINEKRKARTTAADILSGDDAIDVESESQKEETKE